MKKRRNFLFRITAILLLAALLPCAMADHEHWCDQCDENTQFYVDPETGDDVCRVCGYRIPGSPVDPGVPVGDADQPTDPPENTPADDPTDPPEEDPDSPPENPAGNPPVTDPETPSGPPSDTNTTQPGGETIPTTGSTPAETPNQPQEQTTVSPESPADTPAPSPAAASETAVPMPDLTTAAPTASPSPAPTSAPETPVPIPDETTAAPTPASTPEETLPPTVAPATDPPEPTPAPADTPAAKPTAAAPASPPAPSGDDRNPQGKQVTRNWGKYPLYDLKHPDRRLNTEPDTDCEAPGAGTPVFIFTEEDEPISI